jgi:hypothetical protein
MERAFVTECSVAVTARARWNHRPATETRPVMNRIATRPIRSLVRFAAAAALLGAIACSDPVIIDNRQLRPAILINDGVQATIIAASTVDHGQPVDVAITTFGTGCDEIGDTQITGQAGEIEIAPRDWYVIPLPNQVCTADIRQFVHTARLTFDQAGSATIRFVGRSEPAGDDITLVAKITVR